MTAILARLFPHQHETLLLQCTVSESMTLIRAKTYDAGGMDWEERGRYFIGRLGESSFSLTERTRHMQHFIPLIEGILENTAEGCTLLIRYRLYGAAFFYIGLGISLSIAVAIALLLQGSYMYFALCLMVIGAVYGISLANFKIQVRESSRLLRKVLGNVIR